MYCMYKGMFYVQYDERIRIQNTALSHANTYLLFIENKNTLQIKNNKINLHLTVFQLTCTHTKLSSYEPKVKYLMKLKPLNKTYSNILRSFKKEKSSCSFVCVFFIFFIQANRQI